MFFKFIVFSQMQINNSNGNNWSSTMAMIGQIFSLIFIFIGLLFLTYYSTKWIVKVKSGASKSKNMKIIEGINIGVRSSLLIVKVGEQYFLLSVLKDSIAFLSEIKPENIFEIEEESSNSLNFDKYLKDCVEKLKNKRS